MANLFSSFTKKKLFGKGRNLVSFDEPFDVMPRLLKGHAVTGIIDAGASSGRISRRLLRRFPDAQVYAFEPNPLYAAALKQYENEDSRFHPQFLALSDCEGDAALHVTESPGNASLLTPGERLRDIASEGATVKADEKVELVTIDNWAKRNGDLSIELIKLDIQGAELKALRGAARMLEDSTLIVYTEICFNPLYEGGALYGEIDLLLRDYGFGLYDIYKPKCDSRGLIMWANAIFVNLKRLGL
ncbi:MAG: FkbM family methyltransferase [Candidatus Zixiibacteriota bacterium]|nr:MAG: FkbM family methyltransferase [candidate division Zixibacteria bacterium]